MIEQMHQIANNTEMNHQEDELTVLSGAEGNIGYA
jgi:hypothetical protein